MKIIIKKIPLIVLAVIVLMGCNQVANPIDLGGVDPGPSPAEELAIEPASKIDTTCYKGNEFAQLFEASFKNKPIQINRSAIGGWLDIDKTGNNMVGVRGVCHELGETKFKLKVWTNKGSAIYEFRVDVIDNH